MRNFIWKDENKDDVVEDLKNLRKVVPLLDKIDFVTFAENLHESLQTIDYQDINAILTTFYQNHLFQDDVDGDEYFAHFVNALLGFRAADVLNCYSYGESLFSPSKVGFTWLVDTGEETLVDKDGNADTYTVTRQGEIYAVSLVVRLLKDIDVKEAIDNAVIDFVTPLWVKEDTVLFSSKLVRNLVVSYAPLLEYTIFNRMGLSQTYHDCFKLIDFNVLYTLSAEEFKEECKKLKHILTSATRKVDGEYVLTKMLGNIKNINSNELFDTFEEMLLTMSTTYTLTTVKERESVSPYVFGLYHIARKAEVLNIVAGSSDEKYQQALFYGRVGKETDLYSYTVNYINIIRSIQE